MREIVFRGMTRGGEWVGGSLVRAADAALIIAGGEPVEVISESVGEWSGFADRNGVPIYEGDLVRAETPWTPTTLPFTWGVLPCVFEAGAFCLRGREDIPLRGFAPTVTFEVVGKVFKGEVGVKNG